MTKNCGSKGLFPVELSSDAQFKNLAQFLTEGKYLSDDDFKIPIGYKYDLINPFSSWHSLNNDASPSLDDPLKEELKKLSIV